MTPLPGNKLEDESAREVWNRFIATFRDDSPRKHIPTRCQFKKEPGLLFWGTLFDRNWIADSETVYFIEEKDAMQRYPQEIFKASMAQVRGYYARRAPWECADCYILDLTLRWCLVITHDDICMITGEPPPFPYYNQDDPPSDAST